MGSINKSRDKLTKRVNRVKVARLTALGNKLKKLCLWCRLGSKTLTHEPRAPNHRDHELSSVCRKEDELEKAFIFCLEYENETNKKNTPPVACHWDIFWEENYVRNSSTVYYVSYKFSFPLQI